MITIAMTIDTTAPTDSCAARVHFESDVGVHGEGLYPLGQLEQIEHNLFDVVEKFENLHTIHIDARENACISIGSTRECASRYGRSSTPDMFGTASNRMPTPNKAERDSLVCCFESNAARVRIRRCAVGHWQECSERRAVKLLPKHVATSDAR
jgi:hypothetical protein